MAEVRQTIFSPDRQYRYVLFREWDMFNPRCVLFCGLNPSVADETVNDPTIRREIAFAKAWGYGALCKVNAFAYRATNPLEMQAQADPVGPENDVWVRRCAAEADLHIAAWGARGAFRNREVALRRLFVGIPLMCLGVTKDGSPRHSLYLPKGLVPVPWMQ